jgi:predicted RND superfamily exporter protein
VAFAYVSERNLNAMITGTVFALVLVSVILVVAFQSVRTGLVTLVPNLLPALLAFGIWGYLVGDVNLAATVVTSMTFGIIVDDTIHITMKYLRGRRVLGEPPDVAVRQTVSLVGFPVFVTTIAIASGFAVTALSGFQLSVYLGSLTVLIVCIALIADLLLLPALLLVTERIKR